MKYTVREIHNGKEWTCAAFKLQAHADYFAEMMQKSFPNARYYVYVNRKRKRFRLK